MLRANVGQQQLGSGRCSFQEFERSLHWSFSNRSMPRNHRLQVWKSNLRLLDGSRPHLEVGVRNIAYSG
jgi:hypothetical protein